MSKSFTLIEILIAIFIITLGAGAAFNVIQTTTRLTSVTSDQLIASYLAQEGIEVVRNIRDDNWLASRSNPNIAWDANIAGTTSYDLDYSSASFPDPNCNLGADNFLMNDGSFYNCSTGQNTKFKRKIAVDKSQAGMMVVSADVSWEERGNLHHVDVETKLYDWR